MGKVAELKRGRKRKNLSHRKRSPLPKGEGIITNPGGFSAYYITKRN